MITKVEEFFVYIFDEKHQSKIILSLIIIICIFKIPALITSDIQPWDEGMYAVRVLSIHSFGDFFDQTEHSIAKFDSGSHPPLIIWLGYFLTLIFGTSDFMLKVIPFTFALLSVIYIIKFGKIIHSFSLGIFASLIFSSTYLFAVYYKYFQLDIPLTFFILISFYYFLHFLKSEKKKYKILSGLFFGLSLMTKAIVGLYIPVIILIFFIIVKDKIKIKFIDIIILLFIGFAISLPWYLFMFLKHGTEFTNTLFFFHLLSRALESHEGIRRKEYYYFLNILANNFPFIIILAISFVKDIKNIKIINPEKIFLWIWFLTGVISIFFFKTKLETYLFPFIISACILLVLYLLNEKDKIVIEKFFIILLTLINIVWFIIHYYTGSIKNYISYNQITEILLIISILVILQFILFISLKKVLYKFNIKIFFTILIIISFLTLNIYYFIALPGKEKNYVLSEIKNKVEKSGKNKILYISSDYKYNPQFTYYFNGIDMDWNGKYKFELADLKCGTDSIKKQLEKLEKGENVIIVERDYINTGIYFDTKLFIPANFKLIMKNRGYELYED